MPLSEAEVNSVLYKLREEGAIPREADRKKTLSQEEVNGVLGKLRAEGVIKEPVRQTASVQKPVQTAAPKIATPKNTMVTDYNTLMNPTRKRTSEEKKYINDMTQEYFQTHRRWNAYAGNNPESNITYISKEEQEDPNSEWNRMVNLRRSNSALYNLALGALDAVPFVRQASDRANEAYAKSTVPSMSDQLQNARTNNPIATTAGSFAGTAGLYGVGSKMLGEIPVLSQSATKAGQALTKVPVLGKLGAERLGNIVADTSVDIALDTLPELVENVQGGKSREEVAKEAAKNLGVNFAMNLGSDMLQNAWKNRAKNSVPTLDESISASTVKQAAETAVNGSKQTEIDLAKELNPLENITQKKVTDPVEKAFLEPDVYETHTPEQLVDMRKYLNSSDTRIIEFANTVRKSPRNTYIKPLELEKVTVRASEDMKRLTGIDATGNRVVLDRGAIEHIDSRHGIKGSADKSMSDDATLSRIQYVLNNYDIATLGDGTKKIRTKAGEKAPTVVFEKKINGTYYIVEAVTDAKSKTNVIVSAYTSTKKVVDNSTTKDVAYPMGNAGKNPLSLTSETGSELTTKAAYPARNADLTSPFPTSKNEAELTAQTTPTATVNEYNPNHNVQNELRGKRTKDNGSFNNSVLQTPENVNGMSKGDLDILRRENLGDRYNDIMRTSEKNIREESYGQNIARGRVEGVSDEIKNQFINDPALYEKLSNKETIEAAQAIYDSGNAESQIYRLLDAKNPEAIPLGNQIVKDMVADGRTDEAVELMRYMSQKLREGGQFTQAAAINMMKADPETAARYALREIDDLNAKGREKFKGKWKDFSLTEEELKAFEALKPGDSEGIKKVFEQVGERLSKAYPSTTWEKAVELSRIAMLFNPRTQIRNIISNMILAPVRSATDRVSALGQNAIHLVNPKFKVTQSLTGGGKQEKQIATEVWDNVKDSILDSSSAKWDAGLKGIEGDKQVFKGSRFSKGVIGTAGKATGKISGTESAQKTAAMFDNMFPKASQKVREAIGGVRNTVVEDSILESMRNLTYHLLEEGDEPFVKSNFVNRLASYMKAQGIKSVDEVPEDAIMLATSEALKATFKDDNAFTRGFTNFKKSLGKAGEVVMPFTKTPANLAMRGIDYSPAGIVTAFGMAINKKGAAEIMDHLSKGITGTAAMYAGFKLAERGVISGALSSDKDEAAFQKQQGQLPYAIKARGNYYTYDWAQPAAIPFILGASIFQSIEESDKENMTAMEHVYRAVDMAIQAGSSAANSWVELSPLQTIADIFDTSYNSTVPENIINEMIEYPQRFIPSLSGALARTVDPVQRQTYVSGNPLKTQLNTAMAKVPFLSDNLPAARDTWGNEIRRSDTIGEAAFAQLVNPGQLGNSAQTQIDGEIQRLYDSTGNNAVFPRKSEWKVGDVKLSNEQYSELQEQQGKLAYELSEGFINSTEYSSFSDEDKSESLAKIYSLSKGIAENELYGKELSSANKKLYDTYKKDGAIGVIKKLQLDIVSKKQTYDSEDESGKSFSQASWKDNLNTLNQMSNLSDQEKGRYLYEQASSERIEGIQQKYGDAGVYDFYQAMNALTTGGNTSISQKRAVPYLETKEMSTDMKGDYLVGFGAVTLKNSNGTTKAGQVYGNYGSGALYEYVAMNNYDSNGDNRYTQEDQEAYLAQADLPDLTKAYIWKMENPKSKRRNYPWQF